MQPAEYLLHTDVFPGSDLSDIQLEKVQSPKASSTFARARVLNMWFQCFHTSDDVTLLSVIGHEMGIIGLWPPGKIHFASLNFDSSRSPQQAVHD